MKCPKCIENGETSTVYPGPSTSTAMMSRTYYDENGDYHSHDPNTRSVSYRCTKGHDWGEKRNNICPNPSCNWGKELIRNAK